MMTVFLVAGDGTDHFIHPAVRCSECHEKMVKEWRTSLHASAAKSPAYVAFKSDAAAAGVHTQTCERCHVPLAAYAPETTPGVREGVTCDVCHTLKDVHPKKSGAELTLHVDDNTKYGPLCDVKAHYFHRMGCSPLHRTSELCGGCHLYYVETADGKSLGVFTEYEEWLAGPAKREGAECQACHMPTSPGEVARGSKRRPNVPHHGFLGEEGDLYARAVTLEVRLQESEAGRIEVMTDLVNDGAGHSVPAGLPGRRFILRVRAIDITGAVLEEKAREYGRVYTDDAGNEVPFFRATKGRDARLAPLVPDKQQWSFSLNGAAKIEIALLRQSLPAALERQLAIQGVVHTLLSRDIALVDKKSGKKIAWPKKIRLSK